MNSSVKTKNEIPEKDLYLKLVSVIEKNEEVSQRTMASESGVALGLMNMFLKKCIKKGLLKIKKTPLKSYRYFITPAGFAEKSRVVEQYLNRSLNFLRQSKSECEGVYEKCLQNGETRIYVAGSGELAEIAEFVGGLFDMRLIYINSTDEVTDTDIPVLLCDVKNPQDVYDKFILKVQPEKVFTFSAQCINRNVNEVKDAVR